MAGVHTSLIQSAANNTNVVVTPSGTGKLRLSQQAGNATQPIGTDNNGDVRNFLVRELPTGGATTLYTDKAMITKGASTQNTQITLEELVIAGFGNGGAAATNAEQRAGIIKTKYSSPETSVAKDASGVVGAALMPGGTTAQRPAPTRGMMRHNTTLGIMEWYNGTAWVGAGAQAATNAEQRAGTLLTVYSSPQTSVAKDASGVTGAALIPGGTTGQRPAPATGMLRHNSTDTTMEWYNGTAWVVAGPAAATNAEQRLGVLTTKYSSPETSVAKDGPGVTGAILLSGGTDAQRPAPVRGMMRHNTTGSYVEWYNGTAWAQLGAVAATNAEQRAGLLTTVYSSPATSVAKDAATTTGAILLSGGTDGQRPAPVTGMLRHNTTGSYVEWYNGTAWANVAGAGLSAADVKNGVGFDVLDSKIQVDINVLVDRAL